ncbi:Rho termination factor-like protein [Paractinoplanes brasiliensis]|uniref:Rho termination factor-like protein n=1 Tax=Paractinoplanes brasiliensis TaxID=52695 RepID=A0A4R6JL27_9ACTN|nr:Rho termination factor-like protein [Actinoplanes brasiliensis]GID30517.1 hypothetical protein Abr02nite_55000 [Actinoplanes brasiliensis]
MRLQDGEATGHPDQDGAVVGQRDHWEPRVKKGPSDKKAAGGRATKAKTAGGVDANASKDHLLEVAKKLDITGRSKMKRGELVKAVQKKSR